MSTATSPAATAPPCKADATLLHGWRPWLIPAFLLLLVLAPLLRDGLPVTPNGLLPLLPTLRAALGESWLYGGSARAYKLQLALPLMVAAWAIAQQSARLPLLGAGRRAPTWWLAALWLVHPMTLSLLYLDGQPAALWLLVGLAMLFAGLLPGPTTRRTAVALSVVAALLLMVGAAGLSDNAPVAHTSRASSFLATTWPTPTAPRAWLSAFPWLPAGLIHSALGLLALALMWQTGRRRVVLALTLALIGLALLPFWERQWPMVGMAQLTIFALLAHIPALDARYARPPFLLGTVGLAMLMAYPTLQLPWHDATSYAGLADGAASFHQPLASGARGDSHLLLLDARASQQGAMLQVETTWQALGADADYSAFVQFLDADGQQVAQADALLQDEAGVPATGWPRGYVVRQRFTTSHSQPVAQLRLGLYVVDEAGQFLRPALHLLGAGLPGAARLDSQDGLLLPVAQGGAAP